MYCISPCSRLLNYTWLILNFIWGEGCFSTQNTPLFAAICVVSTQEPNYRDAFFVVESICVSWFIIELLLRFISCPSKRSFCRDVMNIFDVLAIVPFFVTLATMQVRCQSCAFSLRPCSRRRGVILRFRVLRRYGVEEGRIKPLSRTFLSYFVWQWYILGIFMHNACNSRMLSLRTEHICLVF